METIKDLLEADSRTSREVSEAAGLSPYYVSTMARGRHFPRLPAIKRLATALGISLGRMLHAAAETVGRRAARLEAAGFDPASPKKGEPPAEDLTILTGDPLAGDPLVDEDEQEGMLEILSEEPELIDPGDFPF